MISTTAKNDPMEPENAGTPPLTRILEALLFATSEPLSVARLSAVLKEFDAAAIRRALVELRAEYGDGRACAIEEMGGGWRLLTRPAYVEYVRRLQKAASTDRLSPAALETLAIVAYKQPVIKAELDAIRGVNSDGTLQGLLRRHLVRVVGRAEVLGRPLLYGTTRLFLDQFGLQSLADLPSIEEAIQKMEQTLTSGDAVAMPAAAAPRPVEPEEDDAILAADLPRVPAFEKDPALAEESARAAAASAAAPRTPAEPSPSSEPGVGRGVTGSETPASAPLEELPDPADDPRAAPGGA